eukprot:gene11737-5075_t
MSFTTVQCECGSSTLKKHLSKHYKSDKHKHYLKTGEKEKPKKRDTPLEPPMTFCQYIDKLDLTFDDPTEKKARLLLLYEEYWNLERIKEYNCECGSKFLREHLPKHKRRKRLPFSSSIRTYETSYQRNKRLLEESKKRIKELEEKMKISSKDTVEYKKLKEEFKNIQEDIKEKEEKIKDWNFWTKLGIIASIILAFGTLWYFEETRKREEEEERRRQEEHRKKYPKID